MTKGKKMSINAERLWSQLEELSHIGRNADGSITRLPFTKEDRLAMDWLCQAMQEAGLQTHHDEAGNLIGEMPGSKRNEPCIALGSHYDTVLNGGAFDGTLGILAPLEALRTLHDEGYQPGRTIRLIAFKDEEGNRFSYGMVGSKAIAGLVTEEGLLAKDKKGITLYQAMKDFGLHPEKLTTCKMDDILAFIELHIEQHTTLETNKKQIGIVEGIKGIERFSIRILGESDHAGATPMAKRKDPVVAMSHWITQVTSCAKNYPGLVATIGKINTLPGEVNIICSEVCFSLDVRSLRKEDMDQLLAKMQEFSKSLEESQQVRIQISKEFSTDPCLCSPILGEKIRKICKQTGKSYQDVISGAGHDAMNLKNVTDIAMIFVPSVNGWSHRKEEYTKKEDCQAGAEVIYELLRELTN